MGACTPVFRGNIIEKNALCKRCAPEALKKANHTVDFVSVVETSRLILTEAAVLERLEQDKAVILHEQLANAMLVYTPAGRQALHAIYHSYIEVAFQAGVPIMIHTPTWRAGRDRIRVSGVEKSLNRDAVDFMRGLRRELLPGRYPIYIGSLIGPQKDCYRPDLAPDENAAERYHAWQVNKLSEAGVDFQIAATLPSVPEAKGLARSLKATGQPYLLSFVINRHGCVLDGTELADAIRMIDRATSDRPPLGYMVNCAYPSFLDMFVLPEDARTRLLGYQANASSKTHADLDSSKARHMDDIYDWTTRMAALHRHWGLKILGGCCGTGPEHLRQLVGEIFRPASKE